MAFFARKPALMRTIKPAIHGKHQDRQDLLEFHGTGDCSRDRLHRSHKTLYRLQDQKHRDIDRQNNEQSADQRGFDEFSNRSHLGLAPNRQFGDGPSSTPGGQGGIAESSKTRCIILNLQRRSCASAFRRLRLTRAPEQEFRFIASRIRLKQCDSEAQDAAGVKSARPSKLALTTRLKCQLRAGYAEITDFTD